MTTDNPSARAVRAAEAVFPDQRGCHKLVAQIIDEQTYLPELIEALEWLLDGVGKVLLREPANMDARISFAKKALSDAKGETL